MKIPFYISLSYHICKKVSYIRYLNLKKETFFILFSHYPFGELSPYHPLMTHPLFLSVTNYKCKI